MFVDAQLEFSDSQVITASAASTNIIDFNPAFNYNTLIDAGAGEPTFLVVIPLSWRCPRPTISDF